MRRMTEEEADALDELVTKNPPRVDPSKARHAIRMVSLDDLSADYLLGNLRKPQTLRYAPSAKCSFTFV